MIGILKSLGANNTTIRKVFLWFSVFLIGKGMLWGNVIGLAFYFLQKWFGIFKLDPRRITWIPFPYPSIFCCSYY